MKLNTDFVTWLRCVAPYVNAFRDKTFVVAFSGENVADEKFIHLVHDINLLASLGVRLVLVHGARPQIDTRLEQCQQRTQFVNGIRITNTAALQCIKESIGRVRTEIEALLSMGLPNSPMANAVMRVTSGNFTVACPLGVVDGCDFMYAGKVRKINASAISSCLKRSEVVLISPLGYSPTGEIFNLTMENVATEVAIALNADKLIFHMNHSALEQTSSQQPDWLPRELTTEEGKLLLKKFSYDTTEQLIEIKQLLACAITASEGGVARVHLINRHINGAMLQELFTHDGIGSMVSQVPLQTIREAKIEDIGGILRLIEPLEAKGVLVRRSREFLEAEIGRFVIFEHDNTIIGCAALYPFPDEFSCELACLTVHSDYTNTGYGSQLLKYIEAKAMTQGHQQLFVLTTHATHWFIEHGFKEAAPVKLPKTKQELYNYQRLAKVFIKTLNT